jgi:hypothetical protein
MTRIASFREALVYGKVFESERVAATMFQEAYRCYRERRIRGITRFNYTKFKAELLFIQGCRKMTRLQSFREATFHGKMAVRNNIAASMFQLCWRAYRMRQIQCIPRFSFAKVKDEMTLLRACRGMSRSRSFKEADFFKHFNARNQLAASMFQICWKNYVVRKRRRGQVK